MDEVLRIRQDRHLHVTFSHPDDAGQFTHVQHLVELSPFAYLLAALGSCTAIILHSYAHYHNVNLDAVDILLRYENPHVKSGPAGQEAIFEQVQFEGDFSPETRHKLAAVAKQCAVHKLLKRGIHIESEIVE